MNSDSIRFLTFEEFPIVEDFLGESPETTASLHHLRRGTCDVAGYFKNDSLESAVIQYPGNCRKTACFGFEADKILSLLKLFENWNIIEAHEELALSLLAELEKQFNRSLNFDEEIIFISHSISDHPGLPEVCELNLKDCALLEPPEMENMLHGYRNHASLLAGAFACAGIVDDKLVSFAWTPSYSARFSEVHVITSDAWQNRGYGKSCTKFIAGKILTTKRTPVFSITRDNAPAMAIAKKLGFYEYSKRVCIYK